MTGQTNTGGITAAQTIPLRAAVLRAGLPESTAVFPSDFDAAAFHAGTTFDGEIVAVASVHPAPPPWDAAAAPGTSWQLRGMAVTETLRGHGLGRDVLECCIVHIARAGGTLVWCNARTPAVAFYERMGFAVRGDEFEIPTAGPHYVMWTPVPAQSVTER